MCCVPSLSLSARSGCCEMSRGPGQLMRGIERELAPRSAAEGLTARDLAQRIYGPDATNAQVRAVARSAGRLVANGFAGRAQTEQRINVYYRADHESGLPSTPVSAIEPGDGGPLPQVDEARLSRVDQQVGQAIEKLPDDQRRVMDLARTGASMSEIAATLGITVSAAYSLMRAMARSANADVVELADAPGIDTASFRPRNVP